MPTFHICAAPTPSKNNRLTSSSHTHALSCAVGNLSRALSLGHRSVQPQITQLETACDIQLLLELLKPGAQRLDIGLLRAAHVAMCGKELRPSAPCSVLLCLQMLNVHHTLVGLDAADGHVEVFHADECAADGPRLSGLALDVHHDRELGAEGPARRTDRAWW